MDDESGESMEPMEEVPLIQLGEAELESYNYSSMGRREKLLIIVPFVFGAVSGASTLNAYVAFATSVRH